MSSQSSVRYSAIVSTALAVATIIEAFADLVIALLLAGAAYYVFDILRKARMLAHKAKREGEEIIEELEEAREDAGGSAIATGAGLAAEIVADILVRPKRKRK